MLDSLIGKCLIEKMIENDHESIQKSLRQSNEQDTFIYVHHID